MTWFFTGAIIASAVISAGVSAKNAHDARKQQRQLADSENKRAQEQVNAANVASQLDKEKDSKDVANVDSGGGSDNLISTGRRKRTGGGINVSSGLGI